jgi:hypothetical protein
MDALNACTIAVSIATVGPLSPPESDGGAASATAGSEVVSAGPSRSTTSETVGT